MFLEKSYKGLFRISKIAWPPCLDFASYNSDLSGSIINGMVTTAFLNYHSYHFF